MTKIKKNAKNKNRFFFLHSSFLLELIIAAVAKKKNLLRKLAKKNCFLDFDWKADKKYPVTIDLMSAISTVWKIDGLVR